MHILHLNSYYSTTALYTNLYNEQEQLGLHLSIYVPVAKEKNISALPCSGTKAKIRPVFHQRDRYIFYLKHYQILRDLKRSYSFSQFQLVHAHSLFSNGWLAYQLKQSYGLPYVVAVRSADVRTFFAKRIYLRHVGIRILEEASRIVFISRNTYQEVLDRYIPAYFRDEFIKKSEVIPNGIDDYWHQHKNTRKSSRLHDPLRIVCTCKLMKEKEIPRLIQYVNTYNQRIQKAELHLIGPSVDEKITQLAKNSPHVIWHGGKNMAEMVQLYREMDIFALISSRETFGLVYAEAMSQALPIIYTRGEGFDGFLANHTVGESVNYQDEREFIQNVNRIIQNYPEMSKRALEAIDAFNWADIAERYQDIYQEICGC